MRRIEGRRRGMFVYLFALSAEMKDECIKKMFSVAGMELDDNGYHVV